MTVAAWPFLAVQLTLLLPSKAGRVSLQIHSNTWRKDSTRFPAAWSSSKLLWKQIFLGRGRMMWKSGILLSPAPTAHRRQTLLCSKNKLSQGLLAHGSALACKVDTFVPYPSTTPLWTIKEDPPHLHSLPYSLVAFMFKLSGLWSYYQSRYQKPIWQLSYRQRSCWDL